MKMISMELTDILYMTENESIHAEMERLRSTILDLQDQLKRVSSQNNEKELPPKTIAVNYNGTARYIPLSEIVMIEADSNYSTLYLVDGKKILTSRTLKYWCSKIKGHSDFIRPHRSFLINTACIVSHRKSTRTIALTGGHEARVARNYKQQF
jgi:two-component system, LytTR family, response regulator